MTSGGQPSRMESSIRVSRLIVALCVGGGALWMASAVDHGFTSTWLEWGRSAWAATLILGVIGAACLFVNAIGVLTNQSLAAVGAGSRSNDARVLTVRQFVAVLVGTTLPIVILATWLEEAFQISAGLTLFASCGVMYLLASLGRPWWLYAAIRRMGWFAAIESDVWMRRLLAALGVACIAFAIVLGP
jgi:hypothetical protein